MTIDRKKNFIINAFFVVLIGIIVYFIFKYLLVWILPFVIGFICAMILQRPVAWLTKKTRMPRGFWSGILVVIILSLLFLLLGVLIYKLYEELRSFLLMLYANAPSMTDSFNELSNQFSGWLISLPDGISESIRQMPAQLLSGGLTMMSDSLKRFTTFVVSSTPGLILTTVISIIACAFITSSYHSITGFVLRQFSDSGQRLIVHAKHLFMNSIVKMLRGYAIILFITFCELAVGLTLIGVDYAIVIALLVALMDILPVLGTGMILIPWGIFEMVLGDFWKGLLIVIIYAIVTVVRNIVEPKIIGAQVGLPAIVTLMAMYIGLQLFGILGIFIFPMVLMIIKQLQDSGMVHIWK